MAKVLITFLFIFLYSCSGITPLNQIDRSSLYSSKFLESVSVTNELIDQSYFDEARAQLAQMDENDLSINEISLKRYLLGRLYLGLDDNEKAIFNFELALSGAGKDNVLISQTFLGLSIGYYKIGIYDRSLESLTKINNQHLSPSEKLNSFSIGYQMAKAYQNQELYEQSLIGLVSMLGDMEYKSDRYFQELLGLLNSKSLNDQKIEALNFLLSKSVPLGSLSLTVAENLIYSGEPSSAIEVINRLEQSEHAPIFELTINELKGRLSDEKKVSPLKIGVILPLSGKYKQYGVEALNGIQVAYERLLKNKNFELNIKDSKSSPVVSSFYAKELFEKDRVGLVIGGLSSSEAKSIFLELKNKQVPFISLAQVFLPRRLKDQFLIELPPSVESEISELVSEKNIKKIGKRGAIIFPLDEAGKFYFNEIFAKVSAEFTLVNAVNYQSNEKDFRDPVKNLLNLKFKKLRSDEYNLMKKYFDAQESSGVRRVQILAPEIDFDWVFIPSRPIEALQLIPGFNYYDAFNTLIIGPSSWNSKKVRRLGSKNRKLHFLDEIKLEGLSELEQEFKSYYLRPSNLISNRAMDAVGVANKIVGTIETQSRNDYLDTLKQKQEIEFVNHHWVLVNSLWIKQLNIHHLSRGIPREGVNN
jgi:hypothetical protein